MTKINCCDCGKSIDVSFTEDYVNQPNNLFHCRSCSITFEHKSNQLKEIMDTHKIKDRQKFVEQLSEFLKKNREDECIMSEEKNGFNEVEFSKFIDRYCDILIQYCDDNITAMQELRTIQKQFLNFNKDELAKFFASISGFTTKCLVSFTNKKLRNNWLKERKNQNET